MGLAVAAGAQGRQAEAATIAEVARDDGSKRGSKGMAKEAGGAPMGRKVVFLRFPNFQILSAFLYRLINMAGIIITYPLYLPKLGK